MKALYFLLIFLVPFYGFGQENFSFSKVIKTNNLSTTDVYIAVNDWFASTYGSSKEVIQVSDKETGKIVGKALMDYSYGKAAYGCYEGNIDYTIKVNIRDGRFKVDIENFIHSVNIGNSKACALGLITTNEMHSTKGMSKKYHNNAWVNIKENCKTYVENIFKSIEESISKYSKSEEEEW